MLLGSMWALHQYKRKEKEKEKFVLFSIHNRSLIRRQPGALHQYPLTWSLLLLTFRLPDRSKIHDRPTLLLTFRLPDGSKIHDRPTLLLTFRLPDRSKIHNRLPYCWLADCLVNWTFMTGLPYCWLTDCLRFITGLPGSACSSSPDSSCPKPLA